MEGEVQGERARTHGPAQTHTDGPDLENTAATADEAPDYAYDNDYEDGTNRFPLWINPATRGGGTDT